MCFCHKSFKNYCRCTKVIKNNIIGTAGIWRIAAINEAGGWKDRTTVEDMDLAVRASLRGWKFLYLGDLQVFIYLLSNTIFR